MIGFQEKRNIRIFISSTFEDMDVERIELAKTFRELSIKARSYYASLHAVDLRWGIQPGDSVIESCLNEIKNSQPFFLGVIGDRYGSIPSINEFYDNKILQEQYGKWLGDAFAEGMSYTEIEMQYGAFMKMDKMKEKGHIVFYIKDSATRVSNPKIENLIKKINHYKSKGLCDVDSYSSVKELIEKVKSYYGNELETLFPKKKFKEYQIEQIIQKAILEEKASNYIPYYNYCERLDSFIQDNRDQYCVLTGDEGVGKSSLLAYWLMQHKSDNSFLFVYNFIGEGALKYNTETIRTQIYAEVSDLFGMPIPNDKITERDISVLFSEIPMDKPLVIVLDNISKLYRRAENEPETLQWLPIPLDSKVKLIMSNVPNDALEHASIKKEDIVEIRPLQGTENRTKLIENFIGEFGKAKGMSDKEKSIIVESPVCNNCFIIKSILNELIYFGKYDNIADTLNWFVNQNESGYTFFDKLLIHYESQYNETLVKNVLSLLAVSKFGLEEDDIIVMLQVRQFEWSQLFCALNSYLTINNGKIRFIHQSIIDAIDQRYSGDYNAYRQMIINYYEDKIKEVLDLNSNVAIYEVAYQNYIIKDAEKLYSHLSDYKQCRVLFQHDYFNTGIYWKYLIEVDAIKYNIDIYEKFDYENVTKEYADFLLEFSTFCFDVLSNNKAALRYMDICLLVHIKLHGELSLEVAYDYERIGEIVRSTAYFNNPLGQALDYYQKAYQILTELPDNHKYDIFKNLLEMGEIVDQLKISLNENYPLNKALNMLNEIQVESCAIARILDIFANIKFKHGQYKEAREYYRDSIRFREETVHSSHPSIANRYLDIGLTYEEEGNYPEALKQFLLAKEMYESLFGMMHNSCGLAYFFLGRILCKTHKYEEGLNYINEAITIWNTIYGESNINTAEALLHKAKVYSSMNDSDEPCKQARVFAENGIEILEDIGGQEIKINDGYDFLADMYISKYPKIANLYLKKKHLLR